MKQSDDAKAAEQFEEFIKAIADRWGFDWRTGNILNAAVSPSIEQVRAACRIAGIAKGTGLRLVREVGAACEAFQRQWIRGLETTRVEADEVWSFCYSKEKNVPADTPAEVRAQFGWGDVWTWTALDS